MNAFRSGFAKKPDDYPTRRAPHQGIIDHDDVLASDHMRNGVEFQPHRQLPLGFCRHDEAPSGIVAAREAEIEGKAGAARITDRGNRTRIRNRDDDVGVEVHIVLVRQSLSEAGANRMNGFAEIFGIRTRKIDEFEDALVRSSTLLEAVGMMALPVHDHHLSWLDLAVGHRTERVESAGFGGYEDRRAFEADVERAESRGVTRRHERIFVHHDQTVGAFQPRERIGKEIFSPRRFRSGDKMENEFRIRGSLENGALFGQAGAQEAAIGNVAVVTQGDASFVAGCDQRLSVGNARASSRGIAHMAYAEPGWVMFGYETAQDRGDHAQILFRAQATIFVPGDAARFLTAMLKGKEHIE